MGLELLSISLGFCTFEHLLRGRQVVVHSDNKGSEVSVLMCWGGRVARMVVVRALQWSLRRGTAKALDHAQLVHAQWLQAAETGMSLHIRRVATDDNIADPPSREACRHSWWWEDLGAERRVPGLRADGSHRREACAAGAEGCLPRASDLGSPSREVALVTPPTVASAAWQLDHVGDKLLGLL